MKNSATKQARALGLAAALASIAFTAASFAQTAPAKPSPWFGVPLPGPLSDPSKPTFVAHEDAYGASIAGLPRTIPAPLRGQKLMADVKTIVGFSYERRDAGDPLWGRISGLPGEPRTVEWAVKRLEAAGLSNAHSEEYTVERPLWLPQKWEVRLVGDGAYGADSGDVVFKSAFPAAGSKTLAAPVTAPLVFVGRGSAAELANVDLKGKIAVINVVPDDSLFASREKGVAKEAAARGAVGAINAIESPGNLLFNDGRYACGDGPCFFVGGDDGAFLESVIGKAGAAGKKISAKLSLVTETRLNTKALNGVAIIPGRGEEIVIVNAHADAWFDGANDNADGLATQIGLAEYFAKRGKPARTILFMVSGGHHTGNGPAAFLAAHLEVAKNTVMVINLEHLAQIAVGQDARLDPALSGNYENGIWTASTTESIKNAGAANTTPWVMALLGDAAKKYGVVTSYQPSTSVPGDLGAYSRAGLPSVQLISSEVYYHSSGDTAATISQPGLERAALFWADFIEQVVKAPREKLVVAK